MALIVKCTHVSKETAYVNIDNVLVFEAVENGTRFRFANGYYYAVTETPLEIQNLIGAKK
jgi:hypothetical protein